ncbi:tetratricopeptide repeat protein [Paraglaciecola sp. L3A3]|uniref:tetratricopeptide repeat protein n=1 Tax=Paraglaciecola sp. L3A3 TaxID=2686358 RepID=UPI00131EB94D|nr:SEL1-like repeat protein [Paraglaciecola sp. L3A3]
MSRLPITLFIFFSFYLAVAHKTKGNIVEADWLYEQGQFNQANNQYQLAAQIGNSRAMHTLGVMYYQGQGVEKDLVIATMWFNLAAHHGDTASKVSAAYLAKQLTKVQQASLQKLLDKYSESHSQANINTTYYPTLRNELIGSKITHGIHDITHSNLEDEFWEFEQDADFEEDEFFNDDSYSPSSSLTSQSNRPFYLIADILVETDGSVRDIEVVQKWGNTLIALRKLAESHYTPSTINNTPIPIHKRITLGISVDHLRKIDLAEVLSRAVYKSITKVLINTRDSDNPSDQYQLAITLMNFPGLTQTSEQVDQLLLSAATQGVAQAQYVYANKLYQELNDIPAAIYWLSEAAKQSFANAEYRLGELFLISPWITYNQEKAAFWLNRAAQQGHVFALRRAAAIMLGTDQDQLKDPQTAMEYLQHIATKEKNNPEYHYLLALAHNQKIPRDRMLAIKSLNRAIFLGDQLSWNTNDWQQQLTRWQTGSVTVQDLGNQ